MIEDFYALGKSPNANMIMHWLSVVATVPRFWSQQMLASLSLSMKGRKYHNVATDYYTERLVDAISSGCNRYIYLFLLFYFTIYLLNIMIRFACSKKTAQRVSTNASLLREIRDNFEANFAPTVGISVFLYLFLFLFICICILFLFN